MKAVPVKPSTADQAVQQKQAGASINGMGHAGVPQAGPTSYPAKDTALSERRRSPFAAAPAPGTGSSQASISARLPAPLAAAAPGAALNPPLGSDEVLQPANHSRLPEENPASQTAGGAGDSPGADSIKAEPLSGLLVQPSAQTQQVGVAQGTPATSLSQIAVDTYSAESRGRHCQPGTIVPAVLAGEAASLGQQQDHVAVALTQLQRSQGDHQEVPAPPQLPVAWDGAECRDDHQSHSEGACLPQPAAASGALPDSVLVACRRTHTSCPISAGARECSGHR